MSFNLRFGTFVLEGCSEFKGASPYRVTQHRFPRRPGTIAPRVPAKDSKTIQLVGEVWKDSEAQIVQYFELLGKQLDAGRDKLYLRDNDRFLFSVVEHFDWDLAAIRRADVCAKYNLTFVADDPHWYAPTHSEQTTNIGAINTLSFSITNNGGARTPPVFQMTRISSANEQADVMLSHTTTGLFMKWAGSLPNGTVLAFDCVNKTVTALGSNGLATFTGTLRIELEPGLNNFTYTGPGNVTLVSAWHERWGQN